MYKGSTVLTDERYKGGVHRVPLYTHNSSIIKKDVIRPSFVERVCQLALACVSPYLRWQRRFHRLTFAIVSFGPLSHRNDRDAPLFPADSEIAP